ncbi:MAG TPA: tyrosine--tRNA ligase [Candidatus Saccharimonadia bacterium]|nr:tyrosine--tRNA ligase [Candidatus Saccharimonadia bacterium]
MEELLSRGVDQIVGRAELDQALASDRKLRIKFGVDPTRPDLHIGHAVALRKLRAFQELGHTVIFLIGDYTTKIGDPSGKNKTRPMLSGAEIAANVKTYLDQVGLILDVKKAEIRYNSEWLSKLSFGDLVGLASNVSVAQIIERDDFKNRLDAGIELALHELLYPLMQAYDSVALEADVEFGGTDQLFNLLTGRSLQKKLGQAPQIVFTTELLVGLDGTNKMSKSLDNYVAVTDEPTDMYGKIMSLPDNLIAPYYKLCTEIELAIIDELVKTLAGGANPRDAKASLAREIVRIYHGEAAALKAEASWNATYRDKKGPSDEQIETLKIHAHDSATVIDLLPQLQIVPSRSEVRRLISSAGIRVNGEVVTDETLTLKREDLLQVGKRRFFKLD